MDKKLNPNRWESEHGFIGFVAAMILIAAGVFMAAALATKNPEQREAREINAVQNMEKITKALSTYAQKYNRIPCPADPDRFGSIEPFGSEYGSGAGGTNLGSCLNDAVTHTTEGIVPFRTLGLDESDARDTWGNFLTYAVNPAFTFDPTTAAFQAQSPCRLTGTWFEGLYIGVGGGTLSVSNSPTIDIDDHPAVIIGGDGTDIVFDSSANLELTNNEYVRIGGGSGGDVRFIGGSMVDIDDNDLVEIGGNGDIEISTGQNIRLENNTAFVFGKNANIDISGNNSLRIDNISEDGFGDFVPQPAGTVTAPGGGTVSVTPPGGQPGVNGFSGTVYGPYGSGNLNISQPTGLYDLNSSGTTAPTSNTGFGNRHEEKARYCCIELAPLAPLGPSPIVRDDAGTDLWTDVAGTGAYADVDTPSSDLPSAAVESLAFVLISHGPNGAQAAYQDNGTRINSAGYNVEEEENANGINGDNIYISAPRTDTSAVGYFDDIVIWRTQRQLYAETNNGDCSVPW